MRVLITGGAGFIGTAITQRLCSDHEIVLFDNLARNSIRYTDLLDYPNVILVKGDIRDYASVKETVLGFKPQIIFHLAAINGIFTVVKKPVDTMEVDYIGAHNLFKALLQLEHQVERIINVSTGEVYGKHAYNLSEDEATPLPAVGEDRWSYGASKLAAEHLAFSYFRQYSLPITTIRPCGVYGSGQVGEGAVHIFVKNAVADEDIPVHGDGNQIRSWCYIDDFVDGVMLAANSREAIGEVFNIGNPDATVTIYQLAETVKRLAKSKSIIRRIEKDYADIDIRVVNIDKAKRVLGYQPRVGLEEGLIKTINWYRERRDIDESTSS